MGFLSIPGIVANKLYSVVSVSFSSMPCDKSPWEKKECEGWVFNMLTTIDCASSLFNCFSKISRRPLGGRCPFGTSLVRSEKMPNVRFNKDIHDAKWPRMIWNER